MNTYATKGSAGVDLMAVGNYTIKPDERVLVKTNLDGPLLDGDHSIYGLVVPRSGLAINHGITVLNSPGVIDADYTGNIGVILYNTGVDDYDVKDGDRIAQLLTMQMVRLTRFAVEDKDRKGSGYGSTGV